MTNATFTPEHLERWNSADPAFGTTSNYSGADLSPFYVAPISNGRDTSDSITLSNWAVIGSELEKLVTHEESGVTRFGHWAVGWYELWLIHESDTEALKCADQWAASLADYPVASEDALSELEQEAEVQAWDDYGERQWREALEAALEPFTPEDADRYWANELVDILSEDQLYDSWNQLVDRCSWCCQHLSDGPDFNIEDPAKLLTAEVLSALTGLELLPIGQEWRREPYPWAGAEPAPLASTLPLVP
jgi:hypothetical protein